MGAGQPHLLVTRHAPPHCTIDAQQKQPTFFLSTKLCPWLLATIMHVSSQAAHRQLVVIIDSQ
uniref:Uncharacterized protein n=1 Tax=Setaria digitata TaxID=48799 RepID=A0A915PP42_9BILA